MHIIIIHLHRSTLNDHRSAPYWLEISIFLIMNGFLNLKSIHFISGLTLYIKLGLFCTSSLWYQNQLLSIVGCSLEHTQEFRNFFHQHKRWERTYMSNAINYKSLFLNQLCVMTREKAIGLHVSFQCNQWSTMAYKHK